MVRQTGSVSVYVVLALSVLLTASLGVANLASSSMMRVKHDLDSTIAEQASFAALDHITGKAWRDVTSAGKFTAQTYDVSSDVNAIAPGATANVFISPESPTFAWVTATVTYKGITRSTRAYLASREISVWNNAIFGGGGGTGNSINGNVDVRGSVHIMGDGEPFTDLNGNGKWDPGEPYNDLNGNGSYDAPATSSTVDAAMSGGADIGNNYSGIPANLQNAIPAIPTVAGIATLGAEVRAKHGTISLSGSSSVGSGSVVSGMKSTVDGSYVTDGYSGNQGASSVYSDNGTSNQYDLGNVGLQLPVVSGVGAQTYVDKSGTSWTSEQSYLDTKALTIPVNTILGNTASFTYGPDANGNSITFTKGSPGAGLINITGVVRVAGNLQLGGKNNDLTYTGSGTIYCTGNINIDGNLLPTAGKVFPTTTRLGLIAKGNLNLATGNGSSQLSMAAAFYAQGTIKSAKQNQIAGSFVSNNFDMGSNVPSIYQVPSLTTNMPPAMPGDKRFFTIKVRTFRDRSPLPGQSDTFSGGNPFTG